MGWKWEDDDDSSDSKGFGDLVNPSPRTSTEDRCSTRRIVKSSCRTEEVEPGRFIRKCDKTEQILKDCIGRPVEVVESKTEHTEDDVTDEVSRGLHSFESSNSPPFSFPGLRSDIESIERGLFGGLGSFLEAAEEMANGFFGAFDIPSRHSREPPLSGGRWPPSDRRIDRDGSKGSDGSGPYSEISGEVTDV